MTRLVLRARWVLPMDRPPLAGGYVAIDGDRIASVGLDRPGGAVEELGDVVLLPGLVNAHTHLEFSGLSRPLGAGGMSLPAWIRLVIADRKRSGRDIAADIAEGAAESLRSGVTTIGEIATAPAAAYPSGASSPHLVQFQEAIGFSRGRVASVAEDARRRLEAGPPTGGLSPHAPYTVHPELVQRLVETAVAKRAPVAMHLAESREELRLLDRGDGPFRELLEERSMWDDLAIPRGTRPLDYLRLLERAPRSMVIHGNYLNDEEISFVGKSRGTMSVVYCPRTHDYFEHDPYPLQRLRAAGVRVALGTDSRASTPDLAMLGELKSAAHSHPEERPESLLRMATCDAAAALGMADAVGAIAEGKRADLAAFRCRGLNADPYEALLLAENTATRVWVGGREALLT